MIYYILFPLTGRCDTCRPPRLFEIIFIAILLIYAIYDMFIKKQDSVFINIKNKGIYSKLRILKEDIPKDFTEGTILIYKGKKYQYTNKDAVWIYIKE
ncbi:hypothetical protein [Tenacibaculum finnmarkense]|uniref:hypothetical protein n=1 Tax=Tenacibaculum finnmarkense TaxID=2781243 RepID=UPI000C6636DA|nr:hypothetical protein [Tenacibaculum finnmarkense]MCD8438788.1 hypothetical protein [Tenacibaculum finnmarkense genomovar ulcerans]MCG8720735.1 hypothetical protein [Tenacibaculum finnmarkense]SOS55973.1 hypothetical protein TFHFJT_50063 [Tenacibaculum finnmarkense]